MISSNEKPIYFGKIYYLSSLKLDPTDLKSVPFNLIDDEDIIFTALTHLQNDYRGKEVLKIVHEKYKNDKNFVLKVLKKNPSICKLFTEFTNDKDVIMTAIEGGYDSVLDQASDDIISDKEFMTKVIKISESAFFYASDKLKNDKELATLVINISPKEGLRLMSNKLYRDVNILFIAFKKNAIALDESLKSNQDLYQSFEVFLHKKDEKEFLEALKNIDYTTNDPISHPSEISSPMSPSALNIRMIDNILNKIALKSLKPLCIENTFLKTKVIQAIADKEIASLEQNSVPKKKNRKFVY